MKTEKTKNNTIGLVLIALGAFMIAMTLVIAIAAYNNYLYYSIRNSYGYTPSFFRFYFDEVTNGYFNLDLGIIVLIGAVSLIAGIIVKASGKTNSMPKAVPAAVSVVKPLPEKKHSAEEIREYKELLDLGILTEEEFELKKNELCGIK